MAQVCEQVTEPHSRPLRGGEVLRAMAAGADGAWSPAMQDAAAPSVVAVLERLARLQTQVQALATPPGGETQPLAQASMAGRLEGRLALQRLAAALGAVVRRLDHEADAMQQGAQRLAEEALRLRETPPAPAGAGQDAVLAALAKLENRLARLEEKPAPVGAPARSGGSDLEGLRQLALGFRLALQEVQAGARSVEEAAAAVRAHAGAPPPAPESAPVLEAMAALRAEIQELAQRKPAEGVGAGLAAERAELRRLILAFNTVLQRLEQLPTGDAGAVESAAAPAQWSHEEVERIGALIAQQVKLSIAEALAMSARAAQEGRAAGSGGAVTAREALAAVEALTARLARLHEDLQEHAQTVAAQPGLDAEAASALAQRLTEARSCCSEMLDVAVALTRELAPPAPAPASEPESTTRSPLRGAGRSLLSHRQKS
jgi:hypothetical protein